MSQLDEIKARAEGYTDGPWEVSSDSHPYRGGDYVQVDPKQGARSICEVYDQHRANAALIAAAPKLLAALEAVEGMAGKLLDFSDSPPGQDDFNEGIDQGFAIAAKAIRSAIEEALS